MTINLPLAQLATFVSEHPWPSVALVFTLGVVLPAVWSRHPRRRRAALAVLRAVLDVAADVTTALRGIRR